MATQVRTSSGNTTTYVITDAEGANVTVVLTNTFGGGRTVTFVSGGAAGGALHTDGQQTLVTLMQLLSTGLAP